MEPNQFNESPGDMYTSVSMLFLLNNLGTIIVESSQKDLIMFWQIHLVACFLLSGTICASASAFWHVFRMWHMFSARWRQISISCAIYNASEIMYIGNWIDYPQEVPPQKVLLGGPFWGGTSWGHQSSGSPTSIIMFYLYFHSVIGSLGVMRYVYRWSIRDISSRVWIVCLQRWELNNIRQLTDYVVENSRKCICN